MEHQLIGIIGRGFSLGSIPEIELIIIELDGTEEILYLLNGVKQRMGDVQWRVRKPMSFAVIKQATIRMKGYDNIVAYPRKGTEDPQAWISIDSTGTLLVRLELTLSFGENAERERRERSKRIQRRQLELDMLRTISADKLFEWEEKRNNKCAKQIQSFWKKFRANKEGKQDTRTSHPLHRIHVRPEKFDENVDVYYDEDLFKEDSNDVPRLHELDEELNVEAKRQIAGFEWQSTHEHYENIINRTKEVLGLWNKWYFKSKYQRKTLFDHRLRKLDQICLRLSQVENKSLNELEKMSENAKLDATASDTTPALDLLVVTADHGIMEQATKAHQATLARGGLANEWWRVRYGSQERDIRDLKPKSKAWSFESERGLVRDLDDDELSSWWMSYCSNAESLPALLPPTDRQVDQLYMEESIRSEASRIVKEVETRLNAELHPLISHSLTCPPHRMHMLLRNHATKPPTNAMTKILDPMDATGLTDLTLTVDASTMPKSPVRTSKMGSPKVAQKRKSRKGKAMKQHIETLEEQVAILKSQLAKKELDDLKATISSGL